MGHGASMAPTRSTKFTAGEADEDFKDYLENQRQAFELMLNDKLAMETMVEHYYPPSFPILPVVTERTVQVCRQSWDRTKAIKKGESSGMVYFFDVFYARLFERSSLFKEFFKGDMKKKGKVSLGDRADVDRNICGLADKHGMVLVRIMEFLCSLNLKDPRSFEAKMVKLGAMHRKMGIRPWMFSVFVETMVNSLMHVLGKEATYEVSGCWMNLAAYVMRHLLPPAIVGAIKKDESDFAYYDETAQLYANARRAAERRLALQKRTRTPTSLAQDGDKGAAAESCPSGEQTSHKDEEHITPRPNPEGRPAMEKSAKCPAITAPAATATPPAAKNPVPVAALGPLNKLAAKKEECSEEDLVETYHMLGMDSS